MLCVLAQGYHGLFAGLKPCLMLDCCYSGLQFALYEIVRSYAGAGLLLGSELLLLLLRFDSRDIFAISFSKF